MKKYDFDKVIEGVFCIWIFIYVLKCKIKKKYFQLHFGKFIRQNIYLCLNRDN
jgi:hypothetical protein